MLSLVLVFPTVGLGILFYNAFFRQVASQTNRSQTLADDRPIKILHAVCAPVKSRIKET
jgi:hypothetical protein